MIITKKILTAEHIDSQCSDICVLNILLPQFILLFCAQVIFIHANQIVRPQGESEVLTVVRYERSSTSCAFFFL
jgi:hypothetical protein